MAGPGVSMDLNQRCQTEYHGGYDKRQGGGGGPSNLYKLSLTGCPWVPLIRNHYRTEIDHSVHLILLTHTQQQGSEALCTARLQGQSWHRPPSPTVAQARGMKFNI